MAFVRRDGVVGGVVDAGEAAFDEPGVRGAGVDYGDAGFVAESYVGEEVLW